ncbi:IS630 transposase-related protein [Wolbachia endosymbiont (group A) of Anomoia purmunda]|uniref:IS630 transposase-related protein n=1 Tax=Wolbachia endosymbiont (group A) of Anomoia purmunda TaxID=2953978 RepID=UPI00222E96B8|nr:IS630 transposase-related protein [Wolbachia endosymbiont (group A) of Anomoia purmunda]
MELMKYEVSNGIQCRLKEKAISLVERGKSKSEVADLLEIGIAILYKWLKRKEAVKA